MNIILSYVREDTYRSMCGCQLSREYGETPNGNPLGGKWVLRDDLGKFIDRDKYRSDITERNGLTLVGK